MSFVGALRSELAHLQKELRADPRWAKIKQIKGLLSLYDLNGAEVDPTDLSDDQFGPNEITFEARPLTKATQIKNEVERLLTERTIMHRKAILDHLLQKGLMGKEKSPLNNLAAYLSEWRDTFAPDGNGNFMLRSRLVPVSDLGLSWNPPAQAEEELGRSLEHSDPE